MTIAARAKTINAPQIPIINDQLTGKVSASSGVEEGETAISGDAWTGVEDVADGSADAGGMDETDGAGEIDGCGEAEGAGETGTGRLSVNTPKTLKCSTEAVMVRLSRSRLIVVSFSHCPLTVFHQAI